MLPFYPIFQLYFLGIIYIVFTILRYYQGKHVPLKKKPHLYSRVQKGASRASTWAGQLNNTHPTSFPLPLTLFQLHILTFRPTSQSRLFLHTHTHTAAHHCTNILFTNKHHYFGLFARAQHKSINMTTEREEKTRTKNNLLHYTRDERDREEEKEKKIILKPKLVSKPPITRWLCSGDLQREREQLTETKNKTIY